MGGGRAPPEAGDRGVQLTPEAAASARASFRDQEQFATDLVVGFLVDDAADGGDRAADGASRRVEDMVETNVRICVGAVLVRARDRRRDGPPLVLLGKRDQKRAFYPDVWDVLGGHLEPGENAEQALIRELREEAGVTPTEWRSLGEFNEPLPGGDGSIVLHLYAVTSWNGVPRNRSPEEHSEISWFAVEDASRLPLAHPAYPEILRTAVSVATGAGKSGSCEISNPLFTGDSSYAVSRKSPPEGGAGA